MVLLTEAEIARHNKESDCWIIIKGKVYDVTDYLDDHPGGVEIITDLAGQDSTEDFDDVGHSEEAYAQLVDFYIGDVGGVKVGSSGDAGVQKGEEIPAAKAASPLDEEDAKPPQVLEKRPEIFEEPRIRSSKPLKQPKRKEEGSNMLLVGAGVAGLLTVGYFLLKKKK